MGLFDRFFQGADIQLTPKAALALAALTVIASDGVIEDDEVAALVRIVRGDSKAFENAYKVFKDKSSINEMVTMVSKTLTDKQKVAAIAILIDIAMSDGIMAKTEKALLEAYIEAFQVDNDLLNAIMDVISIKNDFSIFE